MIYVAALFYKLHGIFITLFLLFMSLNDFSGGHAVAQWLRHCATNRKVAGSIPDGVIGIFH
jgi:hypothetical protein